MEIDTGGSQSEGQVEEVSSSGAVIDMQEFSDSDDNPYEVPMPPPLTGMASVNPTAPVDFVSASTHNDTVQHQPIVLPSSPQENNKKELKGKMIRLCPRLWKES